MHATDTLVPRAAPSFLGRLLSDEGDTPCHPRRARAGKAPPPCLLSRDTYTDMRISEVDVAEDGLFPISEVVLSVDSRNLYYDWCAKMIFALQQEYEEVDVLQEKVEQREDGRLSVWMRICVESEEVIMVETFMIGNSHWQWAGEEVQLVNGWCCRSCIHRKAFQV